MTAVPRDVISIQSPCRQTPGNMSKYDLWGGEPSSSPQKKTGIDGIGSVMTSSPTSSTTESPSSSQASTLAPGGRPWGPPLYTGRIGTPPTKAVQTSVPPLVEKSQVSSPTCR